MVRQTKENDCPLCGNEGSLFYTRRFFRCPVCDAVFTGKTSLPDELSEKSRYDQHENAVSDPGYQSYVQPLADAIVRLFPPGSPGLDYGSGRDSAAAFLLRQKGYHPRQYDPFYRPDESLLTQRYDYIYACETAEHFHHPAFEFERLFSLLNDRGALFLMTVLYQENIQFERWYYKDDFTHVFFYTDKTLRWIQKKYHLSHLTISDRVIVFIR